MVDRNAPKSRPQAAVYGCLILSGATSLIYELLWTRILSFSFGSTSLAFAAVLAVFFLGLAAGSVLGGRIAHRLTDPFRLYGWLELAIGAYAAASFPLLFELHHLFSLHNAGGGDPSGLAFRFAVAAVVLALPTTCMGATFPILLEQLRRDRSHLAESVGRLYGVNTLGAFLGVYLATHWLIPALGLDKANYAAVAANLLIFIAAYLGSAGRSVSGGRTAAVPAAPTQGGAPSERAGSAVAPSGGIRRYAWVGLVLLAASGWTTLGYEVVWGRVLTIALEGSLYGIGTTLGSFLAGIGLGGLAFSLCARRLKSPETIFHAYLAACLAMIGYLALSRLVLPVEGYLLRSVNLGVRGIAGLHLNFAIGIIFLLPVTAALGFMFPAAVSLYNQGRSNPSEGAGKAYALNTVMSVLGSLSSASFLMDRIGIEGIVFLGALVMLGSLLAAVLIAEAGKPARMAWLALVAAPMLLAAGWWPSIDARTVLVGHVDGRPPSLDRLFLSLGTHFSPSRDLKVYKDGVGATLTVNLSGRSFGLQSNGLPQSGRNMDPPHFNLESSLVGLYPAMHRPDASNALVIGLGAGITTGILRKAGIPQVEVVELEPAMSTICKGIYPEGESPLDDTGVTLRLDDARNFLVRNGYRAEPRTWDIIASQPAHPWVSGAADLFTEEMFRLAYRNLTDGGVFCQWFLETGIDRKSYAALANAFGRVFDRVIVYRAYGGANGLFFIGTKGSPGFSLEKAESLFRRPELRQILVLNGIRNPAGIFRFAVTPIMAGKALLSPDHPVNRDHNAFVESRMPLLPKTAKLPLDGLGGPTFTGPLPSGFVPAGAKESLFVFEAIDLLSGNFAPRGSAEQEDSLRMERLGVFHRNAPSPFREYLAIHLGLALGNVGPAEIDRSIDEAERTGQDLLGHCLRYLRLRKWPAPQGPILPDHFDELPPDFRKKFLSQALLALADADRHEETQSLMRAGEADSAAIGMALILRAHALKEAVFPPLDDSAFQRIYRAAMLDWQDRISYSAALEAYCWSSGRDKHADMIRRSRETREALDLERRLLEGMRLKSAGKFDAALEVLSAVSAENPSLVNPYVARAEIFGRKGHRAGLDSLEAAIHSVIPSPDAYLQRVRDAFNLVQVGFDGDLDASN
jgi:predicted membrane-bound spermidine synthase